MQGNISVCKALGLERLVQRVAGNLPAVHRQEDIFSAAVLAKGHIAAQPALDPAALVVVAAGAFCVVLLPAFEAVDVEFTHIVPDARKVFDQLAVGHDAASLSGGRVIFVGYFVPCFLNSPGVHPFNSRNVLAK